MYLETVCTICTAFLVIAAILAALARMRQRAEEENARSLDLDPALGTSSTTSALFTLAGVLAMIGVGIFAMMLLGWSGGR